MSKAPRAKDGPKPRSLVYRYLAHHMGLTAEQSHTGMFNLVQCRDAWKVLQGRTYSEIKRWAEQNPPERHGAKAA